MQQSRLLGYYSREEKYGAIQSDVGGSVGKRVSYIAIKIYLRKIKDGKGIARAWRENVEIGGFMR